MKTLLVSFNILVVPNGNLLYYNFVYSICKVPLLHARDNV
jgi:hypothetical protein